MSEEEGEKTVKTEKKKTLTLRGAGLSQGTVRQNFSHGRSKSVVVETRKRRITKPTDKAAIIEDKTPPPAAVPAPAEKPALVETTEDAAQGNLSEIEVEARRRALE